MSTPCEMFALCQNEAEGDTAHPILGRVPSCARCAEKLGKNFLQRLTLKSRACRVPLMNLPNAHTVHHLSHGGRLRGFHTYEAAEAWAEATFGLAWRAEVEVR